MLYVLDVNVSTSMKLRRRGSNVVVELGCQVYAM